MNYEKRFNPETISDEELLNELKKLAEKLGRAPSQNDIKKFGNDITKRVYLYRRRFGSLQAAQEKIGYNKNLGGKQLKYSDEELLQEIIRIKNIIDGTPTQDDLKKYGKYPSGAYKRHFGTYNNALKKLSMRPNVKFGQTSDEIKNDIIKIAKILDRAPTVDEFKKYSNTVSFVTAIKKIDGYSNSWNAVLKSCDLDIIYNRNLTEQEFKNEIIRLKTELGRVPGYYDMIQLGKYSPETYAHKYGTYVKALNYLGFDFVPENKWHNQSYTKAKDGQMYRSKFEALIADIFLSLKSAGKIKSYCYEKQVCQERNWSCDFYVIVGNNEIWIEADGMGKNRVEVYDEEHEKIKYYINNNKNFYIINYNKSSKLTEEINNLVDRNSNNDEE